jgi:hypothetical protein
MNAKMRKPKPARYERIMMILAIFDMPFIPFSSTCIHEIGWRQQELPYNDEQAQKVRTPSTSIHKKLRNDKTCSTVLPLAVSFAELYNIIQSNPITSTSHAPKGKLSTDEHDKDSCNIVPVTAA